MTQERREDIYAEFQAMEDGRDQLDGSLILECGKPANMSNFEDRKQLLQSAQDLVERERSFLRKWTLELKNREQLLK